MSRVTYEKELEHCVMQLARLGLKAKSKDVELFVRGIAQGSGIASPKLSDALNLLRKSFPTLLSPLRATPAPGDAQQR